MARDREWLRKYLRDDGCESLPLVPNSPAEGYRGALSDYKAAGRDKNRLYAIILTHLDRAEPLLKSTDPDQQREGLGFIMLAANCATRQIGDLRLARKICDAWLLPCAHLAPDTGSDFVNRSRISRIAGDIFRASQQPKRALQIGMSLQRRRAGSDPSAEPVIIFINGDSVGLNTTGTISNSIESNTTGRIGLEYNARP